MKKEEKAYAVFVRDGEGWQRHSEVLGSPESLIGFLQQNDSLRRMPEGCVAIVEGFRAALEVNPILDCTFQELTNVGTISHFSLEDYYY